ncbi:MAG: polynucleotide adenylyltransferase [Desulfovibrionaceae bacterium]|nr:polynucleotide adenylyltransferase [Desulfovibrionaceae bacterium]
MSRYFLAGGAVRDLLMGLTPRDLDYVFAGPEEEFLTLNPEARKLGAGPAYGLHGREFTALGLDPFSNLLRRDFTINAFLLAEDGVLHMHHSALADLRAGRLSPVSKESLIRDPLRVFRAARFCAQFPGLQPDAFCLSGMAEAARSPAFSALPAERVGQECLKALLGSRPGNFLRVLGKGQALGHWFEELAVAGMIPAGPPPYHDCDVLEHLARVMDRSALEARTRGLDGGIARLTVWMAFCHDLGKVNTAAEMLPHHYQHESRGKGAARSLARRLRLPSRLIRAGILAAGLHMKAGNYPKLRPGTRTDLLMEAYAPGLLQPLFLLAQADSGQTGLLEAAQADLERILAVKLPPEWENRGSASALRLRDLRAMSLASSRRT